ncbi:hypothetical protein [Saccharopolyspora shandongensis]|uniref:hypothetical protein n=1 Tax=Saccharopolyspora shandongensis TaxID=418495 RepID=UPI000B81A379|nr:hypothetical protein [Saccharopolyspora shandongensis]
MDVDQRTAADFGGHGRAGPRGRDRQVRNTRDEGVYFRATSSDNVIQRSFVHDTGTEQPQFGEGVYFG